MTRDYTLDLDDDGVPLLSVFGGKITTYRKLAESALERLAPHLPPMSAPWTAAAPLPGGDIGTQEGFRTALHRDNPFLSDGQVRRFARTYGSLCHHFLADAKRPDDLGEHFGAGLTRAEVDYLIDHEWARDADDILWRRTKLGLRLTPDQAERLARYIAHHRRAVAA